jgi:hypothetical protein
MTKYSQEELTRIHKATIANKKLLSNSKDCGCFHCLNHFPVKKLRYWNDTPYKTAVCPSCNIDSIIGSDTRVDDELLLALNKRYFGVDDIPSQERIASLKKFAELLDEAMNSTDLERSDKIISKSMSIHHIEFPADIMKRGFWLYVWKIMSTDKQYYLYVGRTGDSSSPNASAPFTRMAQHMGSNMKSNALSKHLRSNGINAKSFEFICVGPIFDEQNNMADHKIYRDEIAAAEKKLSEYLRDERGYNVINIVHSKMRLFGNR